MKQLLRRIVLGPRASRRDRGATDPILVIAAIAVSLVLLVGGSFAVGGIISNAQNLNARGDLDKVATAEVAALTELDTYFVYDSHRDSEYRALENGNATGGIGFTPTEGARLIVDVIDGEWLATSYSLTGNVYMRTSLSQETVLIGTSTYVYAAAAAGSYPLRATDTSGAVYPAGFSVENVDDMIFYIDADLPYPFRVGGGTGGTPGAPGTDEIPGYGPPSGDASSGGGGPGLPSIFYPETAIPKGSESYALTPIVSNISGPVEFMAAFGTPPGVDFDYTTGVITGLPASDWNTWEAKQISAAPSAGGQHTCAVTTTGTVKCWGKSSTAQIGPLGGNPNLGDSVPLTLTPVDVTGLPANIEQVEAGRRHTCALASAGSVWCWGLNAIDQLGRGPQGSYSSIGLPAPAQVVGLPSNITQIAAGSNHTCALSSIGGVWCWGDDRGGQIGNGGPVTYNASASSAATPVQVSGLSSGVDYISAGNDHSCAVLSSGQVRCWGLNSVGNVGNGTSVNVVPSPATVLGLAGVSIETVSAGERHTCATSSSGSAYCWGDNGFGQLGNNSSTTATSAVQVSSLTDVSRISASAEHTCAVTSSNVAWCWGRNHHYQLGAGLPTSASSPTPIEVPAFGAGDAAQIETGGNYTCVVTTANGPRCWGYGDVGALGTGSATTLPFPQDVFRAGPQPGFPQEMLVWAYNPDTFEVIAEARFSLTVAP